LCDGANIHPSLRARGLDLCGGAKQSVFFFVARFIINRLLHSLAQSGLSVRNDVVLIYHFAFFQQGKSLAHRLASTCHVWHYNVSKYKFNNLSSKLNLITQIRKYDSQLIRFNCVSFVIISMTQKFFLHKQVLSLQDYSMSAFLPVDTIIQ